jgi:hypothetical protein
MAIPGLLVGLGLLFPPRWLVPWVSAVDGRYAYGCLALLGGGMLMIAAIRFAWVDYAGGRATEEQPMVGGRRSPLDDK